MNKKRPIDASTADRPDDTLRLTRRGVLTVGGALAVGALAGCSAFDGLVDQASEQAVTTRSASPAAFHAGSCDARCADIGQFSSGPADVRYVPPTLRARSQQIDLEGWSTTTATKAQDYNSSRSNKPSSIWWPGPDDEDDDNDGVGTLVTVLDMERALSVHLDRAVEAVGSRSRADATSALAEFSTATTKVRAELDGCPSNVCVTVRENADARKGLASDASDSVDAGEWDQAARALQEARRIVDGDIERLVNDLDSDDDGLPDGTEALYAYLDGEPTIGERFVVSLPDARLRGGDTALGAELTPQRVMDYFIGERDADKCGESDRSAAVHRDLACRNLLAARLDEAAAKRRAVAAFETPEGVVVTGATPEAERAAAMLFVSENGSVTVPETLDAWGKGRSSGEAGVSSTLVCPVTAQPPDCPSPMPALFYVRRCKHDDQLLYTGGWLIDDGALYEDTATLLVGDGPNVVAGVTRSAIEDGGMDLESNVTGRRRKPGRTVYADITLSAPYDPNAEYLPAGAQPVCRDDGTSYWQVQSRESLANGSGDCDDTDAEVTPHCVVAALDAPILHLVDAADASNEVKFKAGAELSKAVN